MLDAKFMERIASEAGTTARQVGAAIELLDAGATIPFIARYRKDVTGNLDEVKLEAIGEANVYYTALLQRRAAVIDNISRQGKLTDELRAAIEACTGKDALEDIYLPFKRKRRTKATVAREQGLEPLAEYIFRLEPGERALDEIAGEFIRPDKAVDSADSALEGARCIVAEWVSVDPGVRAGLRARMMAEGLLATHSTKLSEGKKGKFESYYAFSEPVKKIPGHRLLAVLRGVKEGMLRMELTLDDAAMRAEISGRFVRGAEGPLASQFNLAIDDSYARLLRPSAENEVIATARKRAEDEAIGVFRANAQNLLMAAPAGRIPVMGLDPGLRSGCKLAVIDDTGTFKEEAVVFPEKNEEAMATLRDLMTRNGVVAVAIGNGTGSREAAKFVGDAMTGFDGKKAFTVMVNESGASVYSASKVARDEFPSLDITVRGAISIARRLQDPLAELVKIEPRSIGVGQYQHDVNQKDLRDGLHRTVVSCVNKVGVDLNTASVELLRYVSGIQYGTAQNIVAYRSQHHGFKDRRELLDVDGIGPKVFEQCAGFLRIYNEEAILDSTAIHPENYPIVEKMALSLQVGIKELVRNRELLDKVELAQFETETVGKLALADIRRELLRPARDPRSEFRVAKFMEGVTQIGDLAQGMELEGVITNVTNFGAFVDVGVHQDGLVHLSQLANRFVQDPNDVVKVGQIVRVKVMAVDKDAPRISLSIKALLAAPASQGQRKRPARGAKPAGDANSAPVEKSADGQTPEGPRREHARPDRERKPRPPQGDGQHARPGGRPLDKPGGRPPRKPGDKPSRKPDGRPARPDDRPARGKVIQSGDAAGPLNTLLADQLAGLKSKLTPG